MYQLLEKRQNSELIFSKRSVNNITKSIQNDRPMDFNITEDEKFIVMVSDSIL